MMWVGLGNLYDGIYDVDSIQRFEIEVSMVRVMLSFRAKPRSPIFLMYGGSALHGVWHFDQAAAVIDAEDTAVVTIESRVSESRRSIMLLSRLR